MSPRHPFAAWLPLPDLLKSAEEGAIDLLRKKAGNELSPWLLADFESRGPIPDIYWRAWHGTHDFDVVTAISLFIRDIRACRKAYESGDLKEALRLAVTWMTDPSEWWLSEVEQRLRKIRRRVGAGKSGRSLGIYVYLLIALKATQNEPTSPTSRVLWQSVPMHPRHRKIEVDRDILNQFAEDWERFVETRHLTPSETFVLFRVTEENAVDEKLYQLRRTDAVVSKGLSFKSFQRYVSEARKTLQKGTPRLRSK